MYKCGWNYRHKEIMFTDSDFGVRFIKPDISENSIQNQDNDKSTVGITLHQASIWV